MNEAQPKHTNPMVTWNYASAYGNLTDQELCSIDPARLADKPHAEGKMIIGFGRLLVATPVSDISMFFDHETGIETLSLGSGNSRVLVEGRLVQAVLRSLCARGDEKALNAHTEWKSEVIKWETAQANAVDASEPTTAELIQQLTNKRKVLTLEWSRSKAETQDFIWAEIASLTRQIKELEDGGEA